MLATSDGLTMTDGERLHRRILECPEDDAPRLIYSDWLEENGEEERAKFIRVQIELVHYIKELRAGRAKGRQMVGWTDGHLKDLYREVGNLWVSCRDSVCGGVLPVDCVSIYESDNRFGVDTVVSRGFVESVSMTCEQFCGGPCHHCHGARSCNQCGGTGHIEGVARELFERHPLTTVRLIDKSPLVTQRINVRHYGWHTTANFVRESGSIPQEIMDLMERGDYWVNQYRRWFVTEAAALDAISAACVAHGRKLAGLPTLTA